MKVEHVTEATIRAASRAIEPKYAQSIVAALATWPVRASPDVATARIRRVGASFVVELGPKFAASHLASDDDALALIAHELNHALRGHFGLLPCRSPSRANLQNLALDVLVNAIVARRLVGPPIGLLRRSYPLDAFPACLLRPPIDLERPDVADGASRAEWLAVLDKRGVAARSALRDLATRHLATLGVRHPDAMARLWVDGWTEIQEPSAWWERFVRVLAAEGPQWEQALSELTFLGDHARSGSEPGLGDALRDSWGDGGPVEKHEVRPIRDQRAWRGFLEGVRAVVDASGRSRRGLPTLSDSTTVPLPGRRDVAWLALGVAPALYHPTRPDRRDGEGGVHLYVDMSASAGSLHALFLGLASILVDDLALPAWAFSTRVFPITADDIARGRFRSTGGTDLVPVVDHAERRGARRLVIATDGEFRVAKTLIARARALGLDVLLLVQDDGPRRMTVQRLERLGTVIRVPELFARGDDDIPF